MTAAPYECTPAGAMPLRRPVDGYECPICDCVEESIVVDGDGELVVFECGAAFSRRPEGGEDVVRCYCCESPRRTTTHGGGPGYTRAYECGAIVHVDHLGVVEPLRACPRADWSPWEQDEPCSLAQLAALEWRRKFTRIVR